MLAKKFALAFGIAVVFPAMIHYAVSSFSPEPRWSDYHTAALIDRNSTEYQKQDTAYRAAEKAFEQHLFFVDQFLAASTFVIVGLVTLCVSLPLAYRKVRMNRFYGIRIAQAFVSEARWYDINEYGGRLLARWSWPVTVAGVIGFVAPSHFFLGYLWIALAILVISVFIPLVQTIRWARATRET